MAKYRNLEGEFYRRVDEDPYVRHLHENKLQTLDVEHLPTGLVVNFPGFISQFSQTFNSNWQSNDVYGRMDDIAIFQRTTRSISLGFSTIAYSLANAEQNMEAVDRFVQFLYPMYDTFSARSYGNIGAAMRQDVRIQSSKISARAKKASATKSNTKRINVDKSGNVTKDRFVNRYTIGGYKGGVLKAPPLLRLKLSNLITNTLKDNPQGILKTGLTGKISNLSVTMDVEAGFFDPNEFLLPKKMDLSFQFDVIHSHKVGWEHVGTTFMGGSEFPLGEQRTERYNQLRDLVRSGRGIR